MHWVIRLGTSARPFNCGADFSKRDVHFYGRIASAEFGAICRENTCEDFSLGYARQRTREIGLRSALGAQPVNVMGLILKEGLVLTAIGVSSGLVASLALGRLIQQFLFETRLADPATFAAVSLVVGMGALLAGYIPARRALRVDPIVALRND